MIISLNIEQTIIKRTCTVSRHESIYIPNYWDKPINSKSGKSHYSFRDEQVVEQDASIPFARPAGFALGEWWI